MSGVSVTGVRVRLGKAVALPVESTAESMSLVDQFRGEGVE